MLFYVLKNVGQYKVYSKSHLKTLHTKERWYKEGYIVLDNEIDLPYKIVKASHFKNRMKDKYAIKFNTDKNKDKEEEKSNLYGLWQCKKMTRPKVINGVIQKTKKKVELNFL